MAAPSGDITCPDAGAIGTPLGETLVRRMAAGGFSPEVGRKIGVTSGYSPVGRNCISGSAGTSRGSTVCPRVVADNGGDALIGSGISPALETGIATGAGCEICDLSAVSMALGCGRGACAPSGTASSPTEAALVSTPAGYPRND